ncbi:MAG: twin-arginine translocase TatA/TatE family subunit [Pseudomonadota bacterium]|nr:twin-arginine translocase TatA/TatE family subunit [Pseudomonadota bacterium]|tara:strand:- start:788 stop:970 length:183 start_codon:yes stop_codon:yes gene_type:complete
MFPSWLQILLVVLLALIFFGRGKISDFMTDLASGIKSFRKGMADDNNDENTSLENKDEDN